ncbi:MAG: DUF547 domain-containing protein [Calditrichia bacterium]
MKSVIILLLLFLFTGATRAQEKHAIFSEILKEYVVNSLVTYESLRNDSRLETYLGQLSSTNPDEISDEKERLAFWINAYNAYTLKIVCDNYPLKSIKDLNTGGTIIAYALKKTVWDKDFVVINNRKMTLNNIEHKIVRPIFKDPRAHFALVCAARSCPPLRNEAYEGFKLDDQLNGQGRIFLNDINMNYFEPEKKIAHLSKILDWYGKDFGDSDEEILLFITRFLPGDLAAAIRAEPKEWKIKHTKYDWSLNEWKAPDNN